APPVPPARGTRARWPGAAPVRPKKFLSDRAAKRENAPTPQRGEAPPRLLRRYGSRQDARPDQEHLLLGEDADAIEEVLIRGGLAERALEGGRELSFFGQRAKEARIDDRVHDLRKLSETVGESWRGAKQERNQGDQIGIL